MKTTTSTDIRNETQTGSDSLDSPRNQNERWVNKITYYRKIPTPKPIGYMRKMGEKKADAN